MKKTSQIFEERVNKFVQYNSLMRVKTTAAEKALINLAHDVGVVEFHAIKTIAENERCTMSKIAQDVQLTKGSVTQVVDKLVKKKYVIRKRTEADRRIVYATLTNKGKKLYNTHTETVKNIARALFKKLSVSEQEAVLNMLHKFIEILE